MFIKSDKEALIVKNLSNELRKNILSMSHEAKSAHLGSCLSCVEILEAAMFNCLSLKRLSKENVVDEDKFILSKGHAAMALYAALFELGFLGRDDIQSYCKNGSKLAEHPPFDLNMPSVVATGSLGHGLPVACGLSLASKLKGSKAKTIVCMSDGECNEGSNWEASLFAAAQNLTNLQVVVDYNKWQATGRSNEVLCLHPLASKWHSFGWHAIEVDGHDVNAISSALCDGFFKDKPQVIIAHTVKGKGVSFMEDDNNWHYRSPSREELSLAFEELERN